MESANQTFQLSDFFPKGEGRVGNLENLAGQK